MALWDVNWGEMFALDVSLLELFLRGTIIYLGVYLIFRFIVKRVGASVSISNILVIVIIADAVSDGFMAGMDSVTGALVLALTIAFWDFALEALAFHVPLFKWLQSGEPMLIVEDGRFCRTEMARHLISEEEIMTKLRQQGSEELSSVKRAFLEPDGEISFILKQ